MKKTIMSIFIFILSLYFIVGVFLFIKQRDLIYYPTPSIEHKFEEKTFTNNNIKIKTTILNKGKEKAIIYFGGNAEIVDLNGISFTQIFPKHTVYLVKYRGYSGSEGDISEKNLYSDALYIYDKIKSDHKDVSLIGRSLGSGIATYLASKKNIEKLVLITPFDSIENIAKDIFPIYPISLILKDKYDSLKRVKDIKAKTLIILAQNDKTIKYIHTKKLIDKFPPSQVKTETIKKADHNSISNKVEYYQILKKFMRN